jgi:hypothetical protein
MYKLLLLKTFAVKLSTFAVPAYPYASVPEAEDEPVPSKYLADKFVLVPLK